MIRQMLALCFVTSSVFACAGLDYCPMPVQKKASSWTFFQSFQQVNYDDSGTKSYFQWSPRLEFSLSKNWRIGGHVPFVSLTDKSESGFGNIVVFTDLEVVSEKNNRWLVGLQSEIVTGRTDYGIAASSPQLLPYVTWLPITGDFQWVTTLGYRYSFGKHGVASSEESTLSSVAHLGHDHTPVSTDTYSVNAHSEQEILGRIGAHFPVFSQVTMGVYADTVYVLDADVSSRFLATLGMNLSTKLWDVDVALGGSVPVTDDKRDLGSFYGSMRVGF
jgi:hypothetical protein